jgi:exopolysaccharide biosynthesis polyprenyl glycosylphosphotransferase
VTHAAEPHIRTTSARKHPVPPADRGVSILVRPEVALHQTREGTARRHLVRGILRVLALAVGDAAAAAAAAECVQALVHWFAALVGHGHVPYKSAFEFSGALLISLLLTGNYRRPTLHPVLHLLTGSALGALVVCWSTLWGRPSIGVVPIAALLALVTTSLLLVTRSGLAALAAWLLPEHRRLVPAIIVSSPSAHDSDLAQRSGYRVVGHLALDRRHDPTWAQELASLIRQVRPESVILLGSIDGDQFTRFLEISRNAGCEVLCAPHASESSARWLERRRRRPLIQVQPPTIKAPQVIAKRCVDIVLSCLALLVAAPIGAVIALAIRLDSPGPVFFHQERVGLGGRRFRMIKFRTMRVGADNEKESLAHLNATGDPRLFKIHDDPRVSRVGAFLRKWSLDELPQFLNVLVGQMSLVGPRPFFENDFVDYEEHHFRRLGAKPGITGLWQVYGRSSVVDFEEVVRLDTQYIDQWSLWLDLKVLANTIPAVLRRTGAY